MDILDTEASEDEAARKEVPLNRLKSYEANVELIEKSTRYRSILTQAAESDETVRQKWDEWEENISELTLDEVIRAIMYTWLEADGLNRKFLKPQSHHPQSHQLRKQHHKENRLEIMLVLCVSSSKNLILYAVIEIK